MTWVKENDYYIENNGWTITKANNIKYPYGLYHLNKSHGYFETSDEAKSRHKELTDG